MHLNFLQTKKKKVKCHAKHLTSSLPTLPLPRHSGSISQSEGPWEKWEKSLYPTITHQLCRHDKNFGRELIQRGNPAACIMSNRIRQDSSLKFRHSAKKHRKLETFVLSCSLIVLLLLFAVGTFLYCPYKEAQNPHRAKI